MELTQDELQSIADNMSKVLNDTSNKILEALQSQNICPEGVCDGTGELMNMISDNNGYYQDGTTQCPCTIAE